MVVKPRLWKYMGIWYCSQSGTHSGLGYTPTTAYKDWIVYNGLAIANKK